MYLREYGRLAAWRADMSLCNPCMGSLHDSCEAVQLRRCQHFCRLLQYHPGKRLTAQEALNHPYFKHDPLPGMNCYPQGYNLRIASKVNRDSQKKKAGAAASNATSGGGASSGRPTQGTIAARAANAIASGKVKPSGLSKTVTQAVKKVQKKSGVVKKVKHGKA